MIFPPCYIQVVELSARQLEKLSDLFMDIAKGLLLAAIAVPVIAKGATILESLKAMIAGLLFTYLSLKAIKLAEAKK